MSNSLSIANKVKGKQASILEIFMHSKVNQNSTQNLSTEKLITYIYNSILIVLSTENVHNFFFSNFMSNCKKIQFYFCQVDKNSHVSKYLKHVDLASAGNRQPDWILSPFFFFFFSSCTSYNVEKWTEFQCTSFMGDHFC